MFPPIGIGEVRAIIDDVIKLYRKFKAAHEQINKMGSEMNLLKPYLSDLETLLNQHPSLTRDAPNQISNLRITLKEIHSAAREVLAIFKVWEDNNNFIARAGWAWFGSNPERLHMLSERIQGLRTYLRDWIQLVNSQILVNIHALVGHQRSRAPPPDRSKSVIFLDNFDDGRAVVAQCYARLLQQWTERTGGRWPMSLLHSAGVRVDGQGNVAAAQKSLKMHTTSPGGPPLNAALDALFDNNLIPYRYKHEIWNKAKTHAARSLRDDYSKYDYIIVFDDYIKRGYDQVAGYLEQNHQAKPSKGKLVQLADFHPNPKVRGISKGLQDGNVRDRWNKTVSQIKMAFKIFLKDELDWQQPPPGM